LQCVFFSWQHETPNNNLGFKKSCAKTYKNQHIFFV
jgi:hypothetical protein